MLASMCMACDGCYTPGTVLHEVCPCKFMLISQKCFAPTRCGTCGMLYSKGNAEDDRAHQEFHDGLKHGFKFKASLWNLVAYYTSTTLC